MFYGPASRTQLSPVQAYRTDLSDGPFWTALWGWNELLIDSRLKVRRFQGCYRIAWTGRRRSKQIFRKISLFMAEGMAISFSLSMSLMFSDDFAAKSLIVEPDRLILFVALRRARDAEIVADIDKTHAQFFGQINNLHLTIWFFTENFYTRG